ncbi:hypothetical protein BS17DRAFT_698143, partial [Gyrodon lividus]
GFALVSDMVFVQQSAGRILRAMGVPQEVIRKAEGKQQFPWYCCFNLNPLELGELIGIPNVGRLIHQLVHIFPYS